MIKKNSNNFQKEYIANPNQNEISTSFLYLSKHQGEMFASLLHTLVVYFHNPYSLQNKLEFEVDYSFYKKKFNWTEAFYLTAEQDFRKIYEKAHYTKKKENGNFSIIGFFEKIDYVSNKKKEPSVKFKITEAFASIIKSQKLGYQQLKLKYFPLWSSKYSSFFFYFFSKKKYFDNFQMNIGNIKTLLKIKPNKYKLNFDFFKRVIKPTLNDLNKCDFWKLSAKRKKDKIIWNINYHDLKNTTKQESTDNSQNQPKITTNYRNFENDPKYNELKELEKRNQEKDKTNKENFKKKHGVDWDEI